MIPTMQTFSDRFMAHLDSIGWKPYDVWKCFKAMPDEDRLSEQYLYALCRGDKQPKDDKTLQKLAAIKDLGLPVEALRAWQKLGTATNEEKSAILDELLGEAWLKSRAFQKLIGEAEFLSMVKDEMKERGLLK